jgi:hypothetical protein
MAYTKYSLTPANNNAAPPDGAPEGMLPSAVNDTMRDMMAQIRDVGDGIRGGTYTMTAPVITGGSINGTTVGATTASTGRFSALTNTALTSGRVTYAGTSGVLQDDADFTFNGTTVTMANDASISGLTVGKGGGAVSLNTAVGVNALAGSNSGDGRNTAVGYAALAANTTGANNTAIGQQTLTTNTTGSNNTAINYASLYLNTTGANNTSVGYAALFNNTTASDNTAVGFEAGYSNTTGTTLSAFGYGALKANTTANHNSGFGYAALFNNTTGASNSSFGSVSLLSNTTGSNNVAMGYEALRANTTASNNTAVGYQAGYSNTTSQANTFVGRQAGYGSNSNNASYGNTCIGDSSGYSLTTGFGNSFFGGGYNASGYFITTGNYNVILGGYTGNNGGLDIRTASNYIVLSDGEGNPRGFFDNNGSFYIGGVNSDPSGTSTNGFTYRSDVNALTANRVDGNLFFLGRSTSTGSIVTFRYNSSDVGTISTNGSATAYNTSSDYRLKENIAPMTGALAKVAQLKPVTYIWKATGETSEGFIAHELAEVVPDCVSGQKDAVDDDGKPVYQGVDTSFLVATLTAAIQELKAEFDEYKATHP